ncbi:MAG TPA: PadR family transcriptional regulator [Actinomycetota bacterium]|jgi:DNA-binding PadR family transcriptional regulator|nr:PadR family transcriptional regulator [Actinomycetota bacterium]
MHDDRRERSDARHGGRHPHGGGRHPNHHDTGFGRGFGGPFGGGFGRGWGGPRRARRGDVRTALLRIISERPMHGYDVIKELEQRSGGMWRPSPGSIYPTLQLLEEEGLLKGEEQDGKRVYSITDAGKTELEERSQRSGDAPWDFGPAAEGLGALRDAGMQLVGAAMQVARAGSKEQREKTAEILGDARRKIYALLAE